MAGKSAMRGLGAMVLGAGGGQAVAFLLSPVISRVFSVQEFGTFSVINSAAMILGAVAAFRFDAAVPLPKAAGEARAVMATALLNALMVSTGLLIVIAVIGLAMPTTLSAVLGFAWPTLLGAPVLGLMVSWVLTLNQYAVRNGRFGAVGRRNFLNYGVGAVSQTGLGFLRLGHIGLIGGAIVGQFAALCSLGLDAKLTRGRFFSRRSFMLTWRRFPEFPRQFAPAALLNSLGAFLPPILITFTYSVESAGSFGFAHRMLAFPVGLLATAAAQYYLSRLVDAKSAANGASRRLLLRSSAALAVAGTAGAMVVGGAGPVLFEVIFGTDWRASGELSQWLAVALAAQLVASPISQTLVVFRAARAQLVWDFARFLMVLAVLWVLPLATQLSIDAAVMAYSIATLVFYAASWLICLKVVWKH